MTSNKTDTEETRNPSVFTSKKSDELLILFKLTQKVNKDKRDLEQWKRSNTAICLELCQTCHDKILVWFNNGVILRQTFELLHTIWANCFAQNATQLKSFHQAIKN